MTFSWNGGDNTTDKKVFLKLSDCKCTPEDSLSEEMMDSDITCCPCVKVVERD